ncbi:acyl-CoA carboxylase subunit epsilon [Rhodococcus triatomae]|nr:hypothetical protein G419_25012 [Rhodococcus triatomae BKS 15-14]
MSVDELDTAVSVGAEIGAVSVSDYIESVTITDNALAEVEVLTEAAETIDAAAATEGRQLPVIKVLKGNPSDVDIAAIVAVLAAAGSAATPVDTAPADHWGEPTRMHRVRAPFSPYAFQNRA